MGDYLGLVEDFSYSAVFWDFGVFFHLVRWFRVLEILNYGVYMSFIIDWNCIELVLLLNLASIDDFSEGTIMSIVIEL